MTHVLSRSDLLRIGAGAVASVTGIVPRPLLAAAPASSKAIFDALDEKIEAAMARHRIPGAAVAVLYRGREYVRGYGVTNVRYPEPVDGDTLFRIGSVTKTFTGTAIMRLVDQGSIELDAPVKKYLPDLRLADNSVASRVTMRQILNHSAGWLGDDYAGFGRGDDALARYVAAMKNLPQLTPPGSMFAYNNAAVDLAGRVVEVVTRTPYESAVQKLVLAPLGLKHSGYFTDTLVGYKIAASHVEKDGKPAVDEAAWAFPRSLDATGGLISSANDLLRFARFHLGDGTSGGRRVLSQRALLAMRSDPGPGGTMGFEIDGVCVTWWRRRTAEGVPVFQHTGSWTGQNSDLFLVPQKGFALCILTNSTNGPLLIGEVDRSGWALSHFTGLHNPPAVTETLSRAALAEYEGHYKGGMIPPDGSPDTIESLSVELRADRGGLRASGDLDLSLAFYKKDYVVTTDPDGLVKRSDFVRGSDGRIAWFRDNGRVYRRQA